MGRYTFSGGMSGVGLKWARGSEQHPQTSERALSFFHPSTVRQSERAGETEREEDPRNDVSRHKVSTEIHLGDTKGRCSYILVICAARIAYINIALEWACFTLKWPRMGPIQVRMGAEHIRKSSSPHSFHKIR